ncbi:hypothetical protein PHSY_004931 [Pseudozyma hubeiensis SY62]|uniref:Uncharacterized protein n=1 Tax=Pseudozyma hubeiensis (strain SY62) TaxID=1305764 RepID=R9P7M8_PSEHS|nr:hypothetical protein PHSY_004931 [Pseudozyma hubeiensis SY62]GAC97346.1 hypothetical protein PHSY_004931 [Pseudozyma hubeiensis SY62]
MPADPDGCVTFAVYVVPRSFARLEVPTDLEFREVIESEDTTHTSAQRKRYAIVHRTQVVQGAADGIGRILLSTQTGHESADVHVIQIRIAFWRGRRPEPYRPRTTNALHVVGAIEPSSPSLQPRQDQQHIVKGKQMRMKSRVASNIDILQPTDAWQLLQLLN